MVPGAIPRRSWQEGTSILSLLRAWDGRAPIRLPDEEPADTGRIRYASGAHDGIVTHHGVGGARRPAGVDVVESVLFSVERLVSTGNDHARIALYDLLRDDAAVHHADTIADRLRKQRRFPIESLRPHARWLVAEAAHREPLKLGIVLLGVSGEPDDVADLKLLARHDEFTLYAVVAASQLVADPCDVWWEMARTVSGWGKIHVVERLCQHVDDRDDIRAWLVRHGCDNQVMPEYLAFPCAAAGRLAEALLTPTPDDPLLDGACLIVRALFDGGPSEDIEGYPDGVTALGRLLDHLATRCESLARLDLVRCALDWLEWPAATGGPPRAHVYGEEFGRGARPPGCDEAVWQRRAMLGWTDAARAQLAACCATILSDPEWPARVRAAYASEDPHERWLAWQLAPAVSVDLWETAFRRLEGDPLDAQLYFQLLHTDDLARVARVVALAEARLPLEAVASGPGREHGFAPQFRAHHCIDFLVQEMRRPDVWSELLVAAALRSPLVRNRNMAVAALGERPCARWGERVMVALSATLSDEPDDKLREKLRALEQRTASGSPEPIAALADNS